MCTQISLLKKSSCWTCEMFLLSVFYFCQSLNHRSYSAGTTLLLVDHTNLDAFVLSAGLVLAAIPVQCATCDGAGSLSEPVVDSRTRGQHDRRLLLKLSPHVRERTKGAAAAAARDKRDEKTKDSPQHEHR